MHKSFSRVVILKVALECSPWCPRQRQGENPPTRGVSKTNQCIKGEECMCGMYLPENDCGGRGCYVLSFPDQCSFIPWCESVLKRANNSGQSSSLRTSLLNLKKIPRCLAHQEGQWAKKLCCFESRPKWVVLRARKCISPHCQLILHLWIFNMIGKQKDFTLAVAVL